MVPYKPIVSLIIAFAAASSATASATPLHRRGDGGYPPPYAPPVPRTQCSGARSKCCNEYTSSQNPSMVDLVGSLGFVVGVATGCSALGSTCNNQAVCCTNTQNGLVNIGCSPISL
ncbi:hypothetical protein EDB85DRAFT_2015354 [Lactarius pseudohatsudake]|nr:hypothetical protein EDB85DRAFT_2015354 [Lactarius pseudohatsudake]